MALAQGLGWARQPQRRHGQPRHQQRLFAQADAAGEAAAGDCRGAPGAFEEPAAGVPAGAAAAAAAPGPQPVPGAQPRCARAAGEALGWLRSNMASIDNTKFI